MPPGTRNVGLQGQLHERCAEEELVAEVYCRRGESEVVNCNTVVMIREIVTGYVQPGG
jgi:hypothetical protein